MAGKLVKVRISGGRKMRAAMRRAEEGIGRAIQEAWDRASEWKNANPDSLSIAAQHLKAAEAAFERLPRTPMDHAFRQWAVAIGQIIGNQQTFIVMEHNMPATPSDQDAAAQAAREATSAEARDWVSPRAIAPFELSDIFETWARRTADFDYHHSGGQGGARPVATLRDVDGLGPVYPHHSERPADYGHRIARGVMRLLKEVG